MSQQTPINRPVSITALGFGRGMRAYPRRMEYEGESYNFIDAGLRMVIKTGEQVAEILTMSDGTRDYRLRTDTVGSWTLLSVG